MDNKKQILDQLTRLYGEEGHRVSSQINKKMDGFIDRNPSTSKGQFQLDQEDIILITYADQFQEVDQEPLQSLLKFLGNHLNDTVNHVHILPFYPYSSDDGFSVIDYRQVNPDYGTWDDITNIASKFRLMFDAVINHISRESDWFKDFLRAQPPYDNYFIKIEPDTDLTSIFRPRALPLLTAVETKTGKEYVWTTFSEDQIDLNFANPNVFLEIIDLLLFYIERGASLIRLDAIGYVWKEVGTSSLNLDQAHAIVKILRAVLEEVAPFVGLITETNVPHEENIKYFGDPMERNSGVEASIGGDEAQMIYQFSLAPLILHTFLKADATILTEWASTLTVPYNNAAFFNFIASHDGIGVTPARGILNSSEIEALIESALSHGGEISYKTNSDGSKSAYELNITLFDALNNPSNPDPEIDVMRFLASQAIMLSFAGVPGIYVHSMFGSRNCISCVEETGRARTINREKFSLADLEEKLADPNNVHAMIFNGYKQLIHLRRQNSAFHPGGSQIVLENNPQIFSVLRSDVPKSTHVFCLTNVSPQEQQVRIELKPHGLENIYSFIDLIGDNVIFPVKGEILLNLKPYQTIWLASQQVDESI
jgi:sucrose phosphorylase